MDLSRVIIGPVVTEKAERLKAAERHVHTLRIAPSATKVDVKKALKEFYDVEAVSVRILYTEPKTRSLGTGVMEKRHRSKKALVTLAAESKPLDLSTFKTHST